MPLSPIEDILEELKAGRVVILTDDEDRENEGDLICAAEFTTPEVVNLMLREACGVLCVAMKPERCDELGLPAMVEQNTAQLGTAFTVTVDAVAELGVTTGVSARDRSITIRQLSKADARAEDFDRPGHINPLRAHVDGVLGRAGQTEGSVDLCELARLAPCATIIEVMNEDGTMARMGDLEKFARKHELKICSVADVIAYREKLSVK